MTTLFQFCWKHNFLLFLNLFYCNCIKKGGEGFLCALITRLICANLAPTEQQLGSLKNRKLSLTVVIFQRLTLAGIILSFCGNPLALDWHKVQCHLRFVELFPRFIGQPRMYDMTRLKETCQLLLYSQGSKIDCKKSSMQSWALSGCWMRGDGRI